MNEGGLWTDEEHRRFLIEMGRTDPNPNAVPGRTRGQFMSHRQSYLSHAKQVLTTAGEKANLGTRKFKDGTTVPEAQIQGFIRLAFKGFDEKNKTSTLFNTEDSMARRIWENLSDRGVRCTLMDVKEAGKQTVEPGGHAVVTSSSKTPKPDPDHPESLSATEWSSLYHEQGSIMQSVKAERDSLRQELEILKFRLRKSIGAAKPPHDTIEAVMQDAFATIDFPLVLDLAHHPAAAKIPPTSLQLYVAAANHMLGNDARAAKLFFETAHTPGSDNLLLAMASSKIPSTRQSGRASQAKKATRQATVPYPAVHPQTCKSQATHQALVSIGDI